MQNGAGSKLRIMFIVEYELVHVYALTYSASSIYYW